MAQTGANWKPTKAQERLLNAAQDPELYKNITELCQQTKTPRRTFYNWLQYSPEFKSYWENLWKGSISGSLPSIINAQIDRAEKGDTKAARLLVELMGLLKQQYVHSGGENPIEINHGLSDDGVDLIKRRILGVDN